jgi:hypothetical protein
MPSVWRNFVTVCHFLCALTACHRSFKQILYWLRLISKERFFMRNPAPDF